MSTRWTTVDGNEACAAVGYQLSDVIAIDPITPGGHGRIGGRPVGREAPPLKSRFQLTDQQDHEHDAALVEPARHQIAKRVRSRDLARGQ